MKLKLKRLTKKSHKEIDESMNPINLDYIFDDEDPLNNWLDEMDAPVFDGDDFDWLNLGENDTSIPIEMEEDPVLGVQPPFRYSVDGSEEGHVNESDGHLSPPSSHGGSGDGGNEGRYESGISGTSRYYGDYSNNDIPIHGRTSQHSMGEPTHIYQRRGKQPEVNEVNELPNYLTDTFRRPNMHVGSSDSDNYGDNAPYGYHNFMGPSSYHSGYMSVGDSYKHHNGPHEYMQPPQFEGRPPSYESYHASHDGSSIVNHGTINYGGVHYHQPNYYSDISSSNDQSWMDSATSAFPFQHQARDDDNDVNNNNEEPHRRSFWF